MAKATAQRRITCLVGQWSSFFAATQQQSEGQSVRTCRWTADSLSDAQDIERHFISKGMKGGTGGDLSAYKTVYVYVF